MAARSARSVLPCSRRRWCRVRSVTGSGDFSSMTAVYGDRTFRMYVLGRRWRAEDDRQFGQAAQYQAVAVAPAQRRPWDGQPHGGEAAVQAGERDHALEPGQPGTQAVVDAVAEGQVAGVGPGDVESVRVVVAGRVPVGGGQRDDHLGEGWDDIAAEGDVLGGVPERRVRDRCVPSQDFLDRVRYQ